MPRANSHHTTGATTAPCRFSEDGTLEFPFVTDLPRHCRTIIQTDGAHAPALCTGDFAVVDTRQRDPIDGALFAVAQSRRAYIWKLQAVTETDMKRQGWSELVWYLHPSRRQSMSEAAAEASRQRRENPNIIPVMDFYLSDGPIRESALQEIIIGRVVAIYDPARAAVGAA